MCGICGVVQDDPYPPLSEAALIHMRDLLVHRGPDDAGVYLADGVALGSRRLAILDLSERGHMPMASADGRYHIVYNGEVYNYRELRAPLVARGHVFRSDSDTEVLLALYAEYGPAMLSLLNGMFAIAVWDAQERALFLARDRLGVKPVYYYQATSPGEGGRLLFASEEKALFAAGVPCEFDPGVWEELLHFRYVAGERTPFQGVKRLLPGHYLIWRDGVVSVRRWWNLAERARERQAGLPADAETWYAETFDGAIGLRRISDVPVGVLLSGGLDSGSVAASLALQAGRGVAGFTVGFDEAGYDERDLARQVAERYDLDHHTLTVSPEELLDLAADACWYNDEPPTHANDAHLMAISVYAKPRVTVLLSGEGADETLGGYVRYRPLQFPAALGLARGGFTLARPFLSQSGRAAKLGRMLSLGTTERFVLFNAADVLPGDLGLRSDYRPDESLFAYRRRMLAEATALYPCEPTRQAMYVDQHTYLCSILDRNDRMTMAASIECRVPFLDYRLVETLAALPGDKLLSRRENKRLLRAALGERLPQSVLRRPKWGFGVPWARYLRETPDFAAQVRALPSDPLLESSPLNLAWLQGTVDIFMRGSDERAALIHQLFTLKLWRDAYWERARALHPARAGVTL